LTPLEAFSDAVDDAEMENGTNRNLPVGIDSSSITARKQRFPSDAKKWGAGFQEKSPAAAAGDSFGLWW